MLTTTGAAPAEVSDDAVLAEGVIVTTEGSELPESAEVFAWPSTEALAEFEVGEQFNLEPIGEAAVAADGSFEVVADALPQLSRLASDEGELNLFITADNGAESFDHSFSVSVDDAEPSAAPLGSVDLGEISSTGPIVTDDVDDDAEVDAYLQKACTSTKVTNLGNRWVPVGGLFSANSGATTDFVYSAGQSTSLGVAASQKSPTAGFKASGTASVSSTAAVNFPALSGTGYKLAKTQFRYGTYKTKCTFVSGGVPFTSIGYKVRPDLWVGGTQLSNVSAPTATYCASYAKGSSFTKSKDKQVTWTSSVEIYGVGLSAQTGWSNNGKLTVKFPTKGGRVCGSGNYATQSNAYQIVVKS